MSRLLFEARAAVLVCEAQQALIEKEIELEKLKQPRQWQGLTDEEFSFGIQMASNTSWMKAAKWVEAKLKEKNT